MTRRTPLAAGDPRGTHTPEQALLAGVLERALNDAERFAGSTAVTAREHVRALREWFASTDKRCFSFLYICDHLKLCPESARAVAYRVLAGGRRDSSVAVGDRGSTRAAC